MHLIIYILFKKEMNGKIAGKNLKNETFDFTFIEKFKYHKKIESECSKSIKIFHILTKKQ